MSLELSMIDNDLKIEIFYSRQDGLTGLGDCASLVTIVREIDLIIPLSEVMVVAATTIDDVIEYSYTIKSLDGRNWIQSLFISHGSIDPNMSFQVTDQWKLSEFSIFRILRDAIVKILSRYGPAKIEISRVA